MKVDEYNGDISVEASEITDRQKKYAELGVDYGGKIGRYSLGGVMGTGAVHQSMQNPEAAGLILLGGAVTTYAGYKIGGFSGTRAGLGIGIKAGETVDSVMNHFGFEEDDAEKNLE